MTLAGQPSQPEWRNEHRSATTTYRHYPDGRVSIVWHHRGEAVGWQEEEIFGADRDDAEARWQAYLDERAEKKQATARRRAKWGPRGGWTT